MQKAAWGNYPDAEIISGNVTDAIKKLKAQDGKDLVVWGSISLSQALIKENLFDEYMIQLCPTVTGGGTAMFTSADAYENFHLAGVKKYDSGVVFLRYQPK